jgi:hypothetical protein
MNGVAARLKTLRKLLTEILALAQAMKPAAISMDTMSPTLGDVLKGLVQD